jgi:hypothetical protein
MALFKPGEAYPGVVIGAFGGCDSSQPPTYRVRLDRKWGGYLIDKSNPASPPRYPHLAEKHIIVGNVSEVELVGVIAEKTLSVTV